MTVSDMERARRRSTRDVLTFELVDPRSRSPARVRAADRRVRRTGSASVAPAARRRALELTEYLAPRGRPIRPTRAATTGGSSTSRSSSATWTRLRAAARQHGVAHASTGPQRLPDWNPNAGGIEAFYFRDPDGHFLEMLQFPPGKGDAEWHAHGPAVPRHRPHRDRRRPTPSGRCASTARRSACASPARSENYGIEQEHLNNVFGARLRITTLRAPTGARRRAARVPRAAQRTADPADLSAADVAHWQTTVVTPRNRSVRATRCVRRLARIASGRHTAGEPLSFARGAPRSRSRCARRAPRRTLKRFRVAAPSKQRRSRFVHPSETPGADKP